MSRKPNRNRSARIFIRPSVQIAAYLDQLVKLGIHGKTPSEIAKTFVGNEVERLIREKILELKRPVADATKRGRTNE